VIYETHVRGLTVHPSSVTSSPGTFLGVIEKIPYLRELGITAIELMPVQAFNTHEIDRNDSTSGGRLRNYWGYNPVALFAPHPGYAGDAVPGAALHAFKTMVLELHRAGIEVILDVVFNHTGEAGEGGPTYSFRGLDNVIYYMLSPDKRHYADYAGTGNTLNCNHPVVRSLIVDCLRYWVTHFHIDGFRFDLASILGRDPSGRPLSNPPLLEQIAEDPLLRDVKLIAEAWDLGGAFQVGSFPGQRWAEWNCHFRDDVRRFWRGDPGVTGAFATRLCGSADLYETNAETPLNSINFVTCHDGFTLNDLVSYTRKHNETNGEGNRDGVDENFSENNGVEGPTGDPEIEAIRLRQIRNTLASLLLSRGVPMILGGDEFRRTQHGNNNAYCQDNETSWVDWRLAAANSGLVRFVRGLIAFRRAHPVLAAERFYTADEITWLGPAGEAPDWHGPRNRIGCVIREGDGAALCLLFNGSHEPCAFALPPGTWADWMVAVDTAVPPPFDIADPGSEVPLAAPGSVALPARSTKVLLRPGGSTPEERQATDKIG
jgi:glycogen operon protein